MTDNLLLLILFIVSVVFNIVALSLFSILLKRPEWLGGQIDKSHRDRLSALEIQYQKQSAELSEKLALRTRLVNDEINTLREQMKYDIASEMETYRQSKIEDADKIFEERVKLIKQKTNEVARKLTEDFEAYRLDIEQQKQTLEGKLESLKSFEASAINARIRMYEEQNKEKFYMLNIEETEVEEIEELMTVMNRLKNPLPLKKAIFDIYYRQPIKDLIQRVVDQNQNTGVYKITLPQTGECYVGQSVNISNRFLQHFKAGFGLETYSANKLYPAMSKYGVHSFRFEVVEYCEADLLTEKEKYWADYFGAKEFGFSMKN